MQYAILTLKIPPIRPVSGFCPFFHGLKIFILQLFYSLCLYRYGICWKEGDIPPLVELLEFNATKVVDFLQ